MPAVRVCQNMWSIISKQIHFLLISFLYNYLCILMIQKANEIFLELIVTDSMTSCALQEIKMEILSISCIKVWNFYRKENPWLIFSSPEPNAQMALMSRTESTSIWYLSILIEFKFKFPPKEGNDLQMDPTATSKVKTCTNMRSRWNLIFSESNNRWHNKRQKGHSGHPLVLFWKVWTAESI